MAAQGLGEVLDYKEWDAEKNKWLDSFDQR
jgi:hypothetical protein